MSIWRLQYSHLRIVTHQGVVSIFRFRNLVSFPISFVVSCLQCLKSVISILTVSCWVNGDCLVLVPKHLYQVNFGCSTITKEAYFKIPRCWNIINITIHYILNGRYLNLLINPLFISKVKHRSDWKQYASSVLQWIALEFCCTFTMRSIMILFQPDKCMVVFLFLNSMVYHLTF